MADPRIVPQLVEQPSPRPTNKLSAAGIGAAVATAVVALLSIWVEVPAGLEGGLATIVALVAGYFVKDRANR